MRVGLFLLLAATWTTAVSCLVLRQWAASSRRSDSEVDDKIGV